jgi:hypothetical protein
MKTIIPVFSIAFCLLLLSCNKDNAEFSNPDHGKLKRKLYYRWTNDTVPYRISEYQYDSKGRIAKIQDNLSTEELFEYNKNDELIRKFTYQTDASGTSLQDTTCYKYENGKLIYEESTQLPVSEYSSSVQIKYEYANSKLIWEKQYQNHIFSSMTEYEYSGDLCSKELYYVDSTRVQLYSYRSFVYDKNKLSMTTLIGYAAGNQKYFLQSVYYIYDDSGNLIIEDAEQNMEISGWISYMYKYEYY